MYGNYCGPYWSGGAYVSSRDDVTPGVDALDELCRKHDLQYARRTNLKQADIEFATNAVKLGWRGLAYGIIVGVQGRLRPDDSPTTMPNLRRSQPKAKQLNENKQTKAVTTTAIAPVAISTIRRLEKPTMQSSKNGMVLKHRTFIGSISSSTAYTATEIKCNPGLSGSFPWASKLASRFEKYRIKSLTYHYYSVVATSSAGVVSMSFDYDVLDELPTAKFIQAETTPFVEGNNWASFSMKVPTDNEWRYVRQGDINDVDLKTYDAGKLICATEYAAGAATIGEIYVDYEIELKNPTEATALYASYVGTGTSANPFTLLSVSGTSQPCTAAANTCTFVVNGELLFTYMINGTGITAIALPTISVGTLTSVLGTVINAGGTWGLRIFKVRASKGAVITFGAPTLTTVVTTNLYISECDFDKVVFMA